MVSHPKNSSPGPNAIAFKAYSLISDLATDVLSQCTLALLDPDALDPPNDFNVAYLACLAKTPSWSDPEVGDIYKASDTRPLSVVNCDNRLLAGHLRVVLQDAANLFCHQSQRGFLLHHHILENVLEADHCLRSGVLSGSSGALVFLDFKAAFPSIAHEYLWRALEHIGLPPNIICALKRFYFHSDQTLKLFGEEWGSFAAAACVRQGCPLSPPLFALVMDIFPVHLHDTFPDIRVWAYADDLAIWIPNQDLDLWNSIASSFGSFFASSCLGLNYKKCVVVPCGSVEDFRGFLDSTLWSQMSVCSSAKYLGFYLGPRLLLEEMISHQIQKYLKRVDDAHSVKGQGPSYVSFLQHLC